MFKDCVSINAYAKINLTLDVLEKRSDGYHEVDTIMQSVSLHDKINVKRTQVPGEILISVGDSRIPADERNIAHKAARAFFKFTETENSGISIDIRKSIPVCAGLAGGSADGAGVIVALNKLFDTRLSVEKMREIGASIGADVPFCIEGGTMRCRGIGEKIMHIEPMPKCSIVIAKPDKGVSTAAAYTAVDEKANFARPDTEKMLSALKNADLVGVSENLCNAFDSALCLPSTQKICRIMREAGALGAQMSGSGSAVFGIFDSEEKARLAVHRLKRRYRTVQLCAPVRSGVVIKER